MNASPGFRRAVALGLLVLVLVAFWRFGVAPAWQAWNEGREEVARLRDALARFQGLSLARADYERALAEERRAPGLRGALIEAESATLAAAKLQQSVKALVEGAGGSLVSSQPTEAASEGPFTRVGLNVRMLLSTPALQKVLHALETQRPVLVVDEMLVLARGARARTRSRRSTRPADQLDVRMELGGFLAPVVAEERPGG